MVVGTVGMRGGGLTVVDGTGVGFVEEVTPFLAMGDHAVDGAPVGETSDVSVVDEEVGLQLAGEVGIVVGGLLGVVAIGGIELYTTLTAPLEGLVEKLALATGPEDDAMAVGNEHLQRLNGEGALLTDLRVAVLDDRTVKIYCNDHEFIYDLQIYDLLFIF